jgi:hypothetical protein
VILGWVAKAGPYTVERIVCPYAGDNVDLGVPATGVMHTTEGSWAGAMAVFKNHYAPHFLVDQGRIAQLVPLGKMASALEHTGPPETNRWARVQVEVVGYSKENPWLPRPKTLDALAWLMQTLLGTAAIPLTRPFVDLMPPKPWATESFVRRHAGKWGKVPGWYGHVEVPGNSHWDPGALDWSTLIDTAITKHPEPAHKFKPWEARSLKENQWRERVFGEGSHAGKDPIMPPYPDAPREYLERAIPFLLRRSSGG